MRLAVFPLQEHDRFRPLAALGLDLPEDLDGGAKRDRKPRLLIERAQLELRRRQFVGLARDAFGLSEVTGR